VRKELRLHPGIQFEVSIREGTIILQPLPVDTVTALYGMYPDIDFLTDLEAEHRREIESDPPIRS
jgi:hypothetical protein